jgi:L,D-transpeptidase catalytic domain
VVRLNAPVYPGSQLPSLSTAAAGAWKIEGDSEVFTPDSTLAPCSSYTLTIWPGTTATAHLPLSRRRTVHIDVACPPVVALQQALARLGYIGAVLHPLHLFHEWRGRLTRREAAARAYAPPHGPLRPDPSDAPPVQLGQLDTVTRAALTVYEGTHGLPAAQAPDERTWESLLHDLTFYRRDPRPYTWVTVGMSLPQTVEVHEGSRVALSSLANTGVPGAETERGMFPIYARFVSTSMSGTDPDGVKYDVPDVPWVNYFNGGDAVHGYPRAAYGFPQSNGCVELPIESARTAFGMLELGDIVWVR